MAIDFPGLSSSVQTGGNRGKVGEPTSDRATAAPTAADDAPVRSGQDDTVRISDTAQALQRTASSADSDGVDSDRVTRIRAAIEDGSYRIDNERIAERMLQFDDLLG